MKTCVYEELVLVAKQTLRGRVQNEDDKLDIILELLAYLNRKQPNIFFVLAGYVGPSIISYEQSLYTYKRGLINRAINFYNKNTRKRAKNAGYSNVANTKNEIGVGDVNMELMRYYLSINLKALGE